MSEASFAITAADARIAPNFLIIGAAKSGTSALATQMAQHPDVYIPEKKELHFFDRLFNLTDEERAQSWRRYMEYFKDAGSCKMRGEATVAYTMIPHINVVHDEIFQTLGPIPLIYIVRDPVERIVSQYRHHKKDRPDAEPLDAWIRDLRNMKQCLARSDYERQIAPYRELFSDEKIHICFYEDYKSDYLAELKKIFDFLGVPAGDIAHIKNERVNVISKGAVPAPEVTPETVEFIRSYILENTHKFLSHYGKPTDFWPSMT